MTEHTNSTSSEIKIPPSSKGRLGILVALAVLICGIGIGFALGRITAPTQTAPSPSSTLPAFPQGPPPAQGQPGPPPQ